MGNLHNAHALLIGVGKDLPVTVLDAMAIYNLLADESLAGYNPENIILLTEKNATRQGILDGFDQLISKIDEDSSVLLFYSGHGGLYKPWNQFYLVPNNFDPVEYENSWVTAEELKEKISQIKSRRLVFFLDCCHAAGLTQSIEANKTTASEKPITELKHAEGLAQKIDDGRGMSIVSSCREDQLSYIMEGDFNSLYTKCLQEVLRGEHKKYFEEPFIRISEVVQYVFKKVPERQPLQNPFANLQIYDDFILSRIPEKLLANQPEIAEKQKTENSKEITEEVVTVFRETETANNAILFVHGFSGEAAKTFGKIPEFLMEESKMDGWDMFPFGYSENVNPYLGKGIWASVEDITRIADFLKTSIKYKFGKYKRIAIIAHGLGGLVAQRAILDLDDANLDRISHFILFGTPSNGLEINTASKMWSKRLQDLLSASPFIKNLRSDWNHRFGKKLPFAFKTVVGTKDNYVTPSSALYPYGEKDRATVAGDHFSMITPESTQNDAYHLILDTLNNHAFSNQFTNEEEINNTLGEYEATVKKLLPNVDEIDLKGLKLLIFALEGLGRRTEVMDILLRHPLAKENSDIMGLIGGRYKREYLANYKRSDGEQARFFYQLGLQTAEKQENTGQIFYHAINLAFMSLVFEDDFQNMRSHALKALSAAEKHEMDNLWKWATIAEANMYLNDFGKAKSFYKKAAEMAGIREKISIHINADTAYTCLKNISQTKDDNFRSFLKTTFLS
ncbi:MAG: caspase family protein [Flavobacteriaceae bacterium]|nr:caspase family protein [Flavobacteriaceae bacterium]